MGVSIQWWDWVGIGLGIIGTVGFLMALQPITQAIWGQPRIKVAVATGGKAEKLLWVDISNEPIYKGFLKRLRVFRRPAEGLSVDFIVFDSSGNQTLFKEFHADLKIATGETRNQMVLPASGDGVIVSIATTLLDGTSSLSTTPKSVPIGVGLYSLLVIVSYEGEVIPSRHTFVVGDRPEGTYWVNSS